MRSDEKPSCTLSLLGFNLSRGNFDVRSTVLDTSQTSEFRQQMAVLSSRPIRMAFLQQIIQ